MKNTKGQIMVITLLVLTIITVIVVSVILIASKDVEQQTNTKEYERYLDKAEESIINTINAFDVPNYSLSEIVDDPTLVADNANCSLFDKTVTCNIVDDDGLSEVNLEITDTKDVEDFTVPKDGTFTMDLGNYNGVLKISWTGETAMSFTLGYKRNGEYLSISDVFDKKSVYDTSGNDPLNDVAPENHAFAFRSYLQNLPTSTAITLSDTAGIQSTDQLINLTFKPVIQSADGYTDLTVIASGVLKDQMRVYTATSYAQDLDEFGNSPAPTVVTKIPLYPQVPSILDYVLLSEGTIDKADALANAIIPIPPQCGNGVVNSGEECDDGNAVNTDTCTICCLSNTTQAYTVNSKSSVCSAGGSTPSTGPSCSVPESYGYDDPPSKIDVPIGTDYFIVRSVSGTTTAAPFCGGSAYAADGVTPVTGTITCGARPISGMKGNKMALSGVLLSDSTIPTGTAPARLVYPSDNHNSLAEVRPVAQQSFILGDGRNSGGTQQKFYVPGNGRYLYLGFFESAGFTNGDAKCYGDNCNNITVNLQFIRSKCG